MADSGSRLKQLRWTAVGTRCFHHATRLYMQEFVLTWPKSGGQSASIVRLRTKGHGVCFVCDVRIVLSDYPNVLESEEEQ
jgi:hypothetical protein